MPEPAEVLRWGHPVAAFRLRSTIRRAILA
jgi:hypothetical protein